MNAFRRFPILFASVLTLASLSLLAATRPASEIDALIARVGQARDVVFIRNGSEHSASEAAAHLRHKFDAAHGRITTAEKFIEQIGTRSSITGVAYRVRFADGREVDSAIWLHDLLRGLRAGKHDANRISTPAPGATAELVPAHAGR